MSSSEQDRVRELAERVARRLGDATRVQGEGPGPGGEELAALRASLAEIQRRLAHIESHITHGEDCGDGTRRPDDARSPRDSSPTAPARNPSPTPQTPARSTRLSGTYVPATSHPSQEQFGGLGEAVSELVEFFEREKTCTLEPGGKPCDHCGQCSARGF
ncbi:MAG TPA: hypothetical protein VF570_17070 [Pyrinomonadaceae bacterium]|jgi:hypothetical protein